MDEVSVEADAFWGVAGSRDAVVVGIFFAYTIDEDAAYAGAFLVDGVEGGVGDVFYALQHLLVGAIVHELAIVSHQFLAMVGEIAVHDAFGMVQEEDIDGFFERGKAHFHGLRLFMGVFVARNGVEASVVEDVEFVWLFVAHQQLADGGFIDSQAAQFVDSGTRCPEGTIDNESIGVVRQLHIAGEELSFEFVALLQILQYLRKHLLRRILTGDGVASEVCRMGICPAMVNEERGGEWVFVIFATTALRNGTYHLVLYVATLVVGVVGPEGWGLDDAVQRLVQRSSCVLEVHILRQLLQTFRDFVEEEFYAPAFYLQAFAAVEVDDIVNAGSEGQICKT